MPSVRPMHLALALLLLAPAVASAQEREIEEAGLPRNTTDRLLGIVNDPATSMLPGDAHVPADSVLTGDVVVTGHLRLAGRIGGDLIVVHGDVDLEPGAAVDGDLTVVDGEVRGGEAVAIGGTLIAYRREGRYVRRGDRERHVASDRWGLEADLHRGARMRLSVRGGDYNRVEGLPVRAGPILDTGGRNPFRTEAMLVWRSQGRAAFARDRLGYDVTAEQYLGGRRTVRVGVGAHSLITPIEPAGLTDRENLLSTLLLSTDHRDHFERTGWSAFVRLTPRSLPLDATVEYRDERHGTVGAGDPWSLFTGDRAWRPQPLVAEGTREAVIARVELDTRDDHREPLDGWFVRAEWDQGLGGTLALPAANGPIGEPGEAQDAFGGPELGARFAAGSLDLRRYQPLGRRSGLALRAFVAGSPEGEVLPPQYQRAAGGEGTLPGHRRFTADCGARMTRVGLERGDVTRVMHPYYGCDRMALAQVEYRGPLSLDLGWGREGDDDGSGHSHRKHGPSWAVFFDAAQGWSSGDWGELGRRDSEGIYDAGLGLLFDQAGVYWAVPLGEGIRGSTFTVRLDRRF